MQKIINENKIIAGKKKKERKIFSRNRFQLILHLIPIRKEILIVEISRQGRLVWENSIINA